MPAINTYPIADFSGGLNLNPDPFKLAPNESPDLLNVNLNSRGGFEQRDGCTQLVFGTVTATRINSLHVFKPEGGGTARLLRATQSGLLQYFDGATFVTVPSAPLMGAGPIRYAAFKDKLYMQSGTVAPLRWDGTVAASVVLSDVMGWNDNREAPTIPPANGKMPRAKFMCSWMGSMFIAAVTEGSTLYPNRVRWSHPNFPEDWHSKDYIDVDTGHDGDVITALVPFGDRLLVFKRRSIHVIQGAPPQSLTTQPLTNELGTMTQDSVVSTDLGVYFFDPTEGVYLIAPNGGLQYQFENIYYAMRDGRISRTTIDQTILGWGNRRLWVSLPFEGAATRSDVFVLDPALGGRRSPGAWTRYQYGGGLAVGPFVEWDAAGGPYVFYAGVWTTGSNSQVILLDQNTSADSIAATAGHISSYLRTAWIDMNNPAQFKRWKRPEIIMRAGTQAELPVGVYLDYDSAHPPRMFTIRTTGQSGTALQWGTGLPGTKWGSNKWAATSSRLNEIEQGAPLGMARSVQLQFNGPITDVDWGVNQVTFKFIPRKVKG